MNCKSFEVENKLSQFQILCSVWHKLEKERKRNRFTSFEPNNSWGEEHLGYTLGEVEPLIPSLQLVFKCY